MSEFSISSEDFKEGEEIPKNCGYKHGNRQPELAYIGTPDGTETLAYVMDDPDAMEGHIIAEAKLTGTYAP